MRKHKLQRSIVRIRTRLYKAQPHALNILETINKFGQWLNPFNHHGTKRIVHAVCIVTVLFAGILINNIRVEHGRYSLTPAVSTMVGSVSNNLSQQITYDSSKQAYIFNEAGMTPSTETVGPDKVPLSLLQAKIGGNKSKAKSLYSVEIPKDSKKGITYYDSNTGLSFQLIPNFTQLGAKQVNGHIVYPINNDVQAVYSVKNNGLKEDIILKKFISDSFIYRYSLKLPQTLEARMLTDGSGSLGIYSADPSLFSSNSIFGSDSAKLESAQLHAQKDHLVFAIPAPVIKQTDDRGQTTGNSRASANFALSNDGETLTVSAYNLKSLHYPVSIDPTVVITSTSDFATGNNEDNISYPANQINRGSLTGGSISGGWTATTALPVATNAATTVAYNGYVYEIGGYTTTNVNTVSYAPINANGTIGAWTATTSLPTATSYSASVAYNGYLYEIGGASPSVTATVHYAPINTNGTIGSWTATTSLPVANSYGTYVAYNGYLYEIGGNTPSTVATVNYATINANGTLGAWTATTALPAATYAATSVVYNGYIYEIGGVNPSVTASVYYAPINSDGTVGAWVATTSLPAATYGATSVVYNGYVYEVGGYTTAVTATVSYAPINANGTLGTWTSTVALPTATYYATSVVYNGYVYEIGGNTPSTVATVSYAKIDPAGTITAYSATTTLPATIDLATSVVYNGYIYEIGGYNGSSLLSTVYYAPINANGTIGAWTATTALPTLNRDAASVVYNGYIYEIGGYNGSSLLSTVYYAPINTNGTIGAWTATTSLPATTYAATAVAYNGYIYEIGGNTGSATANVYYAPINTNGTIGSWTATTSLTTATYYATSVVYNGYIYEIGGNTGSVTANVYYAPINSNGTVGAWTATTVLPTATQYATSVVYNGYIYEIGGNTGSATANVYYAPINTNGTIGSWTATTSLQVANYLATSVVYNGYLYEIGGSTGSPVSTVYYARINNGGPGTVGAWTATTALPAANRDTSSATYNGYIYEVGGYNGSGFVNTVYFGQLNSDGTVGSWTTTTALPATVAKGQAITYNGYLYYIGGYNGTATVNTVYYAQINSDGTVGAWNTTTSLAVANEYASSAVYNGYIYNIGGDNGAFTTAVYYALINSNGTIGAWNTTTALPVATNLATSVVNNGYLYEIGGNTGSATANVYYALINSNGTIGAWTATTALLTATYAATSVVYNGYLYEIGGWNGTTYFTTVNYAPINANGTIGSWTVTTPISTATNVASSVVYNGYLYEIGGWNGSSTFATVNYAPLNVMPRIGHFSSIFNFKTLIMPAGITYNGRLPNVSGSNSIQYRTAGSDAVLGASQSASALSVSAALCFNGSAQYVDVFMTLDDSGSAAFPDVSSTPASVTDLSVTYAIAHSAPSVRLRGGKTFISNSLQSLDTCRSPITLTAPSAIGGLVTSKGAPAVTLTWTQAVSTTASPVEGIDVLKNGVVVATLIPTATAYRYTGLSSGAGTTYTFSVRPKNIVGLQAGTPITVTLYTAAAAPATYSCPGGGSYQGTGTAAGSCGTYVSSYSCPSGGSLSGTTCYVTNYYPYPATSSGTAYYPYPATSSGTAYYPYPASSSTPNYYPYPATSTTYSCPSGGSLSGTTCTITGGIIGYTCPSPGILSGTTCTENKTGCDCSYAATPVYGTSTYSATATTTYCNSGGSWNGSNCGISSYTTTYCNSGGSWNGSNCGTYSYTTYCNSGGSWNGSNCGTYSYTTYCNSGGSWNGTDCGTYQTSYGATANYSNYPAATVSSYTYSCPTGGTLYATECSN